MFKFKDTKHKVEWILKNHEPARDSDRRLYAYFYYHYHKDQLEFHDGKWQLPLENFIKVPNPYDIQRARQRIQKPDYLAPTNPKIYELRFRKQIEVRKELGYNPEFAEPVQYKD